MLTLLPGLTSGDVSTLYLHDRNYPEMGQQSCCPSPSTFGGGCTTRRRHGGGIGADRGGRVAEAKDRCAISTRRFGRRDHRQERSLRGRLGDRSRTGNSGMKAPERGDLVWLDFDPQAGREQAGRRPALVLTPSLYNRPSGLVLVCPITSQVKGYPFEVLLPEDGPVRGVLLCDQLRSLDWRARRVKLIAPAPAQVLEEVLARVRALMGDDEG